MRQILQHLRTGEIELAELPAPGVRPGCLLIQTAASLISPGTERMLVEFSQANLLQKARRQPDKVRQVLDKLRADGLLPTLEAVFRKLDEPLPLGYCNAGRVIEVGAGVAGVLAGDRVVSNGPHAELVCVPRNLCARIPDGVDDESAAFAIMGAIALQGLRLAAPTLGERFLVFGCGLLGLLAVQLLRAHGCEVLAADLHDGRLDLAERFGAGAIRLGRGADLAAAAAAWTADRGVDGVLITASATTDAIVHQSAQACRKRGRIVLVGVVGLNLRRSDFYEKELSFQVSCSYGPGRYDPRYEQGGQDYPFGFVRWTAQRNFEAVLEALRARRLEVAPLITDRFPFAEAPLAYARVQEASDALGILLRYPPDVERAPALRLVPERPTPAGRPVVGVIGAGSFARGILLPALARTKAQLAYVASRGAAGARDAARRFHAEQAVTDLQLVLGDPRVEAVLVLVHHEAHAELVCRALAAGKHVFVEKPLALDAGELERVAAAYRAAGDRQLVVGYNRRFSPHVARVLRLIEGRREPLCMTMTVNAGALPPEHWTQDRTRAGGRIIGEGCHFIDLLAHLAGSAVTAVSAAIVGPGPAVREDKTWIGLSFADGSIGTVHYFANGSRRYPKEQLEVFCGGRVARLDNFRLTRAYGFGAFRRFRTFRQDKGHAAEMGAFIERIASGGAPLMPFEQLCNVSRASFAAVAAACEGRTIRL
jgi:predicted dehydrogenase/threonine dehydrogenase-like Zn-dependent dehydrogenase